MTLLSLSIPQIGQPDSTEDPKVANNFTTIQAWAAGNIDASNISAALGFVKLTYRQMNANATAASGDWVVAAPGVTVTLPAPSANLIVGVLANGSVTAASPVTISGTNLYGEGLSAAASFVLGVPMNSVILESDGTSWATVAGKQDTGWVDIASLGAGVSQGTPHGQSRLIGDHVELRGQLGAPSLASGTTACTLPVGQRPPVAFKFALWFGTGTTATGSIATTGVLSLNSGSPGTLFLDNTRFSL